MKNVFFQFCPADATADATAATAAVAAITLDMFSQVLYPGVYTLLDVLSVDSRYAEIP